MHDFYAGVYVDFKTVIVMGGLPIVWALFWIMFFVVIG